MGSTISFAEGRLESTPTAESSGGTGCPVKDPMVQGGGASGESNGVSSPRTDSSGGCPVKHGAKHGADATPSAAHTMRSAGAREDSTGGCPVKHGQNASSPAVYDVSAENIDPMNNMPVNQQDAPFPGQRFALSTERVQSSILKGSGGHGESTWTYPSSQQFYNALKRKNKDDEVQEEDMDMVVNVHNNMNERSWNKLLLWENEHCAECPEGPRLARFLGRPEDLTPKAWLKSWLGYGKPFDRHDWVVDRCGKEVRYVIDYYYDEERADGDRPPTLRSSNDIKSIDMDVRPALDSLGSVFDRCRMLWRTGLGGDPSGDMHPSELPEQQEGQERQERPRSMGAGMETGVGGASAASKGEGGEEPASLQETAPSEEASSAAYNTTLSAAEVQGTFERVKNECGKCKFDLAECSSEETCNEASLNLTVCLGSIICPEQARLYQADPSPDTFISLQERLSAFENEAMAALQRDRH